MSVKQAVANALSFASLAGLGRAKGARAESDEEKDKEKKDSDAKAESEEDEAKAEDDKPEDKDDEKKESKKAEGKDDDESDDDEKKEKAATATLQPSAGTPAERQRCKAIVAHGVKMAVAAGGDLAPVVDACMLAFDTDVSADAAIASMSARADVAATLPRKATGQALDQRMGAEQVPIAKPEAGRVDASDPKAIASMVIASAKKARGEA